MRALIPGAGLLLRAGLVLCAVIFMRCAWAGADVDRFDYPKELLFELSVMIAAAMCLLASRRWSSTGIDVALAVFVAWAVVSALAARPPNPGMAWRSVGLSIASAATFWTAGTIAGRGGRRSLIVAVAIAAALAAVAVVVEAQGGPGVSLPLRGPSGTQGVRNYAAHLVVLGLPALVVMVLTCRSAIGAVAAAAGVAISVAALVLTRSRAAWIAVAAMTAVALLLRLVGGGAGRRGVRRWPVPLVCAAVSIGLAFAILAPHRLVWREDNPYLATLRGVVDGDSGSGRGRLLQYQNTLAMIADHPLFGVGPGQWTVFYPRYAPPGDPTFQPMSLWSTPARATSDWMGFASERGLPGALALCAVLGLAVMACLRRVGRGDADPAMILCTCAGALVLAALDCPLQMAAPSFTLFVVLAGAPVRPTRSFCVPRAVRVGSAALALIAAVALTWFHGRQIQALRLASSARSTGDWEQAALVSIGMPRLHLVCAEMWMRVDHRAPALAHTRAALALRPGWDLAAALLPAAQSPEDPWR